MGRRAETEKGGRVEGCVGRTVETVKGGRVEWGGRLKL